MPAEGPANRYSACGVITETFVCTEFAQPAFCDMLCLEAQFQRTVWKSFLTLLPVGDAG